MNLKQLEWIIKKIYKFIVLTIVAINFITISRKCINDRYDKQ